LVESKENDIDELKKILARKDAELMQWQQRQKTTSGKLSTGMLAMLLLLFAVGAYAAYTYISHKATPAKQMAETAKNNTPQSKSDDTALVKKTNTGTTKPNRTAKQNTVKKDTERRQRPQTSAETPTVFTAEEENPQQEPSVQATNTSYEGPANPRQKSIGLYTVNEKAFFYTEPDESTRRNAFIVKWNNAVLAALNDKPGFIYVVYTNKEGQTSRGWLRKADLTRVDQ
jgi:serine/threonine-protein kinase